MRSMRSSQRSRAGGGVRAGKRVCGCWFGGCVGYTLPRGMGGDAGLPHFHERRGDGRHTRRCRVVVPGDVSGNEVLVMPTLSWVKFAFACVPAGVWVVWRACVCGGCACCADCGRRVPRFDFCSTLLRGFISGWWLSLCNINLKRRTNLLTEGDVEKLLRRNAGAANER